MSENRYNFTDNRLRSIQPAPSGKRQYYFDTKAPGLRLQVTGKGTKTFQFQTRNKKIGNKVTTTTIGRYPATSIIKAREAVAELMNATLSGEDVEERIRSVKAESNLDELFTLWLETHAKPHKKSWDEDERRYNLYFRSQIGKKKLSWFNSTRVRQWHHKITTMPKQRGKDGNTVSPTTANRALALLSTIFNQGAPDLPNPCRGVKKFKERSRERFLSPEELRRFFIAMDEPQTPETLRDYLLLSLYIGARRSNILAMKWSDIDLAEGIWTISGKESKSGEIMRIPLVPQAIDVLSRRKESTTSIFVLSSDKSRSGHMEEPKTAWKSLLKRAGLENVRLHDLRRTTGSYMAISGVNLPAISKALGHQNQSTTAIYARLDIDPVREGMKRAADIMSATRGMEKKVVNLKK